MHAELPAINIEEVVRADPIAPSRSLQFLMLLCVTVGFVTFSVGLWSYPADLLWGSYYVSLLFFMGLSAGGVMISAIFQIVRATWSAPIRRLAEANAAFLPIAYVLFLVTYFGKEHLFPWANAPRPGSEWWMQPNFVYARFAVLLGFLFFMMSRYVLMSLRGDIGLIRERSPEKRFWNRWFYTALTRNWKGTEAEVRELQPKLSFNAPVLVIFYALIYSFFSFEMIMAMDRMWMSNLFGGFMFMGNVYIAWAVLGMSTVYHSSKEPKFGKMVSTNQLWDLGKLTFGFCMIWGYFFWSQFLPQWYGNLPEETAFIITRIREYPWKGFAWCTFAACFICPFILLLSRDLKKTPAAYATVCLLIFIGIWCEKYLIVMPKMTPDGIPFSGFDVGIFLGFLGMYVLSIQTFLANLPYAPVSHPVARGVTEW